MQWYNTFAARQLAALHFQHPELRDSCWFNDGLVAIIAHDGGRTWARYLADAHIEFEINGRGRAATAEAVLVKTILEYNGGMLAVLERQEQKHATEVAGLHDVVADLRLQVGNMNQSLESIIGLLGIMVEQRPADPADSADPADPTRNPPLLVLPSVPEVPVPRVLLSTPIDPADPRRPGRWWENEQGEESPEWEQLKVQYDRSSLKGKSSKDMPYNWPISIYAPGQYTGDTWPTDVHRAWHSPQRTGPTAEKSAGQIHPPLSWLFDHMPAEKKVAARGITKDLPNSLAISGSTSSEPRVKAFRKFQEVYEHLRQRYRIFDGDQSTRSAFESACDDGAMLKVAPTAAAYHTKFCSNEVANAKARAAKRKATAPATGGGGKRPGTAEPTESEHM